MSTPRTPRSIGAGSERGQWLCLETYAEERDGWTPSYRADIDRRLQVSDGEEQRVRRSNGEELVATWEEWPGWKGWLDANGQPLDDVTHVWLGRARQRSGAQWSETDYAEHGYGTVKLRLPVATLRTLDELAERSGKSRTAIVCDAIEKAGRK